MLTSIGPNWAKIGLHCKNAELPSFRNASWATRRACSFNIRAATLVSSNSMASIPPQRPWTSHRLACGNSPSTRRPHLARYCWGERGRRPVAVPNGRGLARRDGRAEEPRGRQAAGRPLRRHDGSPPGRRACARPGARWAEARVAGQRRKHRATVSSATQDWACG